MNDEQTTAPRRTGSETRAEILRVSLELFTRLGYEGTSIRDIADALGMTKSSLYYHFAGKDAILAALTTDRRDELDDLLAWVDEQPPAPDLLQRTALRWVESTTPQRIQGMRFAHANRPVMERLGGVDGVGDIRGAFDAVVDRLVGPESPIEERLRVRLAFETVNAVLFAAQGTEVTLEQIVDAARSATIALTTRR